MGVPLSSSTAMGDCDLIAVMNQISHEALILFLVHFKQQRTDRDIHHKISTGPAEPHSPFAGTTVFRLIDPPMPKVIQSQQLVTGPEDDVSALPSVTAVGPTFGDVFFPAKGGTPVATPAGPDQDFGFINKTHKIFPAKSNKRSRLE
jgi:hypothetical protein